jgi:uncharacterized membrane protein YfcA
VLSRVDVVTQTTTILSVGGLLALLLRRRLGRPELEALAILTAGLLANAAIFGGLSAPADRYQARLVWLLPLLLALVWLGRRRAHDRGAAPWPRGAAAERGASGL